MSILTVIVGLGVLGLALGLLGVTLALYLIGKGLHIPSSANPVTRTQDCYVHKGRTAPHQCDYCQNPMCDECRSDIEEWHNDGPNIIKRTLTICTLCDLAIKESGKPSPQGAIKHMGRDVYKGKETDRLLAIVNGANLTQGGLDKAKRLRNIGSFMTRENSFYDSGKAVLFSLGGSAGLFGCMLLLGLLGLVGDNTGLMCCNGMLLVPMAAFLALMAFAFVKWKGKVGAIQDGIAHLNEGK